MEDPQEIATASKVARALAPGFFASLSIWIGGRQDRENLALDREMVRELRQAGPAYFRYRGLAMEYEAFEDAHHEEIERLVSNTVGAMLKAESIVDESKVDPSKLNPEFRRRWLSEVSNVSDETLQELWARLLAGELESPGSVSNDTMSIARDMNKERAAEFQTLCSAALYEVDGTPIIVVGFGNPRHKYVEALWIGFEVLMRLAHHRLIVNEMNAYREFVWDSIPVRHLVKHADSTWLLRPSDAAENKEASIRVKGDTVHPAGEELFAVVQKIPNPAYTSAMLNSLSKDGWQMTLAPSVK